jgi:hypothetical protein
MERTRSFGSLHVREYSQWCRMPEVLLGKFCGSRYLLIFSETEVKEIFTLFDMNRTV